MNAWLSWGQLGVLGVSGDIAGAFALALSFMTKNPAKIAGEAPVHGFMMGNSYLAKSLARQRAEAQVGLCFLVTGFGAQAAVYFLADGNASIRGWREVLIAVTLMAAPLAILTGIFRWFVPRSAASTWERTWRLDNLGKPLEGEALAAAERAYGRPSE